MLVTEVALSSVVMLSAGTTLSPPSSSPTNTQTTSGKGALNTEQLKSTLSPCDTVRSSGASVMFGEAREMQYSTMKPVYSALTTSGQQNSGLNREVVSLQKSKTIAQVLLGGFWIKDKFPGLR